MIRQDHVTVRVVCPFSREGIRTIIVDRLTDGEGFAPIYNGCDDMSGCTKCMECVKNVTVKLTNRRDVPYEELLDP